MGGSLLALVVLSPPPKVGLYALLFFRVKSVVFHDVMLFLFVFPNIFIVVVSSLV